MAALIARQARYVRVAGRAGFCRACGWGVAAAAFGSYLTGLDVVAHARLGNSLCAPQHFGDGRAECVAGAVFCASAATARHVSLAINAYRGVPRMRPVHADLCFLRLDMWGYPALSCLKSTIIH